MVGISNRLDLGAAILSAGGGGWRQLGSFLL